MKTDAEIIAEQFHASYEHFAPEFAYTTREASAKPWADVPQNNRHLMITVVEDLLLRGIIYAPRDVQG